MGAGEQRAARRALRACMVAEEGRKERRKRPSRAKVACSSPRTHARRGEINRADDPAAPPTDSPPPPLYVFLFLSFHSLLFPDPPSPLPKTLTGIEEIENSAKHAE